MYISRDKGHSGFFLCFPDDWIVCVCVCVNIKLFYREYFNILNSLQLYKYSCSYISGLGNKFSHIWSYTAWSCQTYLSLMKETACVCTRERALVDCGCWSGTPAVLMGESVSNKQLFHLNTDVQNMLKGARYSVMCFFEGKGKKLNWNTSICNFIVKMFWRCTVCVLTGFCFRFAHHMQIFFFFVDETHLQPVTYLIFCFIKWPVPVEEWSLWTEGRVNYKLCNWFDRW